MTCDNKASCDSGGAPSNDAFTIKPKLATIFEIANDLESTIEMMQIEIRKSNPDKDLIERLVQKAKIGAISVNGLLKR